MADSEQVETSSCFFQSCPQGRDLFRSLQQVYFDPGLKQQYSYVYVSLHKMFNTSQTGFAFPFKPQTLA